tara:strand:+ start:2290 stop:3933 length:1644 start_codon:yes stop_codon:yes gene_type:complete
MIILSDLLDDVNKVFNKFDLNEKIQLRTSSNNKYDFQINNLVKYQQHENIKEIESTIFEILNLSKKLNKFEITENYFINLNINLESIIPIIQNIEKHIIKNNQEKIIIDYGGPNIGKPLHVGHLRSLNIGRSLYAMNVMAGNHVTSDIHLGDWGMPVAQIICYCLEEDISISNLKINELIEIYPEASKLSIENEEFNKKSKEINKKLNNLDKEIVENWKVLKNLSVLSIKETLVKLNHNFDLWLGESDVNHLIPDLLESLKEREKIIEDDGAYISAMDSDPKILITKSDGSYLYLTTDLATVENRLKNEDFDKTLYIVDNRQKFHFEQLFKSLNFFEFAEKEYEHIGFGTVNDKNGNPFKTRDGGIKELLELFYETCEYIEKINPKLNKETIETLANSVLTFSDLITNRKTDYKFDLEKFTNISGKTGIYVQYALVRANKLIKRSELDIKKIEFTFSELDNNDISLLKSMVRFEIYFDQALQSSEPHHLAEYLYTLSFEFNRFYQSVNILKNENPKIKSNKLLICSLFINYSNILMKSLGIEPVEEM